LEKKLIGYKGTLTPQQIADGINAANKNANRLTSDAKFLLDAGRYPSATSLAILSLEFGLNSTQEEILPKIYAV
jgi:hypothetical protein